MEQTGLEKKCYICYEVGFRDLGGGIKSSKDLIHITFGYRSNESNRSLSLCRMCGLQVKNKIEMCAEDNDFSENVPVSY